MFMLLTRAHGIFKLLINLICVRGDMFSVIFSFIKLRKARGELISICLTKDILVNDDTVASQLM